VSTTDVHYTMYIALEVYVVKFIGSPALLRSENYPIPVKASENVVVVCGELIQTCSCKSGKRDRH